MKYQLVAGTKKEIVFAIILIGLLSLLIAKKSYAAKNYSAANHPQFSGNFAPENQQLFDGLIVVSYNIRYAENIDQAIVELQKLQTQNGLDIILLQEMDEKGTKQIAKALNHNFVYYPASIEPRYDKNFGNAILSRWPIISSEKLILPHQSFSSQMNRTATRATIGIQESDILVYSIHTETIFTFPKFREDQFKAVIENIDPESKFAIVGGDFNSVTSTNVDRVEDIYTQAGFVRASQNSGHTLIKYRVEAMADHIFSKGFQILEDGKLENATASDHLPIWVKLSLP